MDSILEKELDDFLDMVKRQLKNYSMMLVKEQYQNLYQEHQKLIARVGQLEQNIEKLKRGKPQVKELK